MDILEQIAQRIIKDQEMIIGPLAFEEASHVSGLDFDPSNNLVSLSGDKKKLIDLLVARYERLFGLASVQVCKDAAAPLLPELEEKDRPQSLR